MDTLEDQIYSAHAVCLNLVFLAKKKITTQLRLKQTVIQTNISYYKTNISHQ